MPTYKSSERRGTLPGCSRDLWVFTIPGLWREEEIEVVEATLRAIAQDQYNRLQSFSGLGIWKLSVSYSHTRFEARYGIQEFEARTAQELADAIAHDYAALTRSWNQKRRMKS